MASVTDALSKCFDLKADSIRGFQNRLRNVVKIPYENKYANFQNSLPNSILRGQKIVTYKGPDVLRR